MMNKRLFRDQRSHPGVFLAALLHFAASFFTDRLVFTVPPSVNPADFVICKLLLLLLLFFLYRSLYRILFFRERQSTLEYQILKTVLPYLVPLAAVLAFKLPQGFLSNDEAIIFESAAGLEHYTWFYYLTVYYYIVSLMLIPSSLGPILVKAALQACVCGYCVYRLKRQTGGLEGAAGYLLFLLFPVLAYTTSAHRLPIYFLLYLCLCLILLMDRLEDADCPPAKLFALLLLGAVLTQWRTEGIYLALLLPVLLVLAYQNLRTIRKIAVLAVCWFAIQYLVFIPQNGLLSSQLDSQAENRMGPFYAYTITNMYRNGLDLLANERELQQVDRFLSLDVIQSINEYYEDINYEDVLILYQPGYTGTRENASPEDYQAYTKACRRIFLNNPGVFLKTRWGAFCYAALPYSIKTPKDGLPAFGVSIIKTISYNLFIPCTLILLLLLYSLIKKRAFTFFLMSGMAAHWLIVFILAPASYFKYYFPIFIIAYLYLILLIIQAVHNRRCKDRPISFLI